MEDNVFKSAFEMSYETLIEIFKHRKYSDNIDKDEFYKFGMNESVDTFEIGIYTIKKSPVVSKNNRQNKKNSNQLPNYPTGTNVILLIPDESSSKKDSDNTNTNSSVNIVEIYMGDWYYNPLDNERQSQYEVLNTNQRQLLLDYYDIKESNLPKIDINDKISQFFDCKNGDIFKITRYTSKNGIQFYYRIVRVIS